MMVLLAAVGCERLDFHSPHNPKQAASAADPFTSQPRFIDAGIVFAGQSSYRCLALSELGIVGVNAANDVVEVSSSCPCVVGSIMNYWHNPIHVEYALRLDFTPETTASADEIRPVHLAVEVTLTLASGKSHSLTVNVLETQAVVDTPVSIGSEHDANS